MSKEIKKGRKIWFWYGAGKLEVVTFVRWCRTKMGTGREDTNKLGVGVVVESDWLFRIHGGTRTQLILQPYTALYRTDRSAQLHRNEIKRPKLSELIKQTKHE